MYFFNILSLIILFVQEWLQFFCSFVSIDRWKRKEPAYETTKAEEKFLEENSFYEHCLSSHRGTDLYPVPL